MSFRKRSSKPAVRKKPAADDDVSTLITAEAADDSNSDGVIDPLDFLSVAKMKRIRRRQEMASSRQDQDSSTGKQYLESLTEGGIRYASSQMDEAIRQHPTAALFTSSVAAAAAKKRMEEFVEEELRKKRGGETISEVLDKPLAAVMQSEANILISAAQSKLAGRSAVQRDEGGHSGSDGTQQQPVPSSEATFLADTTKILDKLPDDLKSSGREKRPETGQEGIIQASAALLTAVRKCFCFDFLSLLMLFLI
jgi:hypothetical protein